MQHAQMGVAANPITACSEVTIGMHNNKHQHLGNMPHGLLYTLPTQQQSTAAPTPPQKVAAHLTILKRKPDHTNSTGHEGTVQAMATSERSLGSAACSLLRAGLNRDVSLEASCFHHLAVWWCLGWWSWIRQGAGLFWELGPVRLRAAHNQQHDCEQCADVPERCHFVRWFEDLLV